MSVIQAIAKLMEILDNHREDMEPLTMLTKLIAEQEESISGLKQTNEYLKAQLAEANQRAAGGGR